ncbi:NAD(P)H-hydrate dehydratase [Chryseobacterium suipulveris]|uniref:Bifunctional NAD(P)H-hydrate repair enzyme n=1 Tax=Chryseobacterium suipulveris TaxID=2929800 RepID=A0ABY4BVT6_9FLAO|nr:NAD(P)H-hydrate dehydratase [Chryseobacterium suipulveris]UOE41818.1 NAD(P)H-hydrate dehydratase [Chryseobacterium suipulveris]
MKIFNAEQIRNCDKFTIENEPVSSLNLMERAAESCCEWLLKRFKNNETFQIFCGNGNNGGDGFAVARMLYQKGFDVNVFIDQTNANFSPDAAINFEKVKGISGIDIFDFNESANFSFEKNSVIIDALFGSGLNRKLEGKPAKLIQILNQLPYRKISIDIPSGLFADKLPDEDSVIFKADETLSFQCWKKSFLHPETGFFCGNVSVLDIGLSKTFVDAEPTNDFIINDEMIRKIYQPRNDFSHKGTYGKATLVAGSFGKIGAAVLATKSALRTGSGLTFVCAPNCGYEILQSTCPEAMFISGGEKIISNIETEKDSVVAIGPGLGTEDGTVAALLQFLKNYDEPLVLDADALNIISKAPENLKMIPKNSVITPHPKEFERLFGVSENSFERLETAKKNARELGIYIVLKDHHTQIITPENKVFYNITGNSGMAKGGSGDVLTGILVSLLAQNYAPKKAAILAVWLHGKAGDLAAKKYSKESMLLSDLIAEIGTVFKQLK